MKPHNALTGEVVSLHIAAEAGTQMACPSEVTAVAGQGLEGDRYYNREGTWSRYPGGGTEVTLIELEAIRRLGADHNVHIDPREARRNIVTSGVALNDLVGATFRIGDVVLRGVRTCDPCAYLEGLTKPGVHKGLAGSGGLRADILTGGVIRVGDPLTAAEA